MNFFKHFFNFFSYKEDFSYREKIIFLGIFSIITSLVLFNHEMWRDEIQAWLLARDSSNILNLLNNLKYEGHTPLWHLLLFPLTKFQLSISSMQFLSWIIGVLTALIILFISPFGRLEKILFIFGYYFFYEYVILSRNYGISLLLLFLSLHFFSNKKIFLSSIFLSFAALCNVFSLILSSVLGLYFLYKTKFNKIFNVRFIVSIVLYFCTLIFCFLLLYPPEDRAFGLTSNNFVLDLDRFFVVGYKIAHAFFPYTSISFDYLSWNVWSLNPLIASSMFLFSLSFLYRLFCLSNLSFILLSLVALLFFIFQYTIYPASSLRHSGIFFGAYIIFYWISFFEQKPKLNLINSSIYKINSKIYFSSLVLSFLLATYALTFDYFYKFSNSKDAAIYLLKDLNLNDGEDVFVDGSSEGSSVIGYANFNKAFYRQGLRYGSFNKWDKNRLNEGNFSTINFSSFQVLLMSYELVEIPDDFKLTAKFNEKNSVNESFYIYRRKP